MRKTLSAIATAAVLTCAVGAQCLGVALADDRVTELLSAAEKAAKGGDVLEAAVGFGEAAAAAQSKGDLQGESRAADGLSDFLDRVRPAPVAENDETSDSPDRVAAVLAVMEQLDHSHLGAYVSVQSLARFVVDRSVSTGDMRALRQAADALATQASTLTAAPAIDGIIEKEVWGAPQFDGKLYRYPTMSETMAEGTVFWCGAFGCEAVVPFALPIVIN